MCPNCGYCPHCGRGGWIAHPIWRWDPPIYAQPAPPYPNTYWMSGNSGGSLSAANALPFNGMVRLTTTGAAEQPRLNITRFNG